MEVWTLWLRVDNRWQKEYVGRKKLCYGYGEATKLEYLVLKHSDSPLVQRTLRFDVLIEQVEGGYVLTVLDGAGVMLDAEVSNMAWQTVGQDYVIQQLKRRLKRQIGSDCEFRVKRLSSRR